jgi:hypothetical protein
VQIKNDALRAYFLNKRETLIGVPARGWQKTTATQFVVTE